jgi:hypothetical protein
MNTAKPITATIDGETEYKGFTFGERWNGFECPMFTKSVSMQIMNDINETDSFETKSYYSESENAFYFEGEKIESQIIEYKGLEIEVFPIGSFGWTWQDANE